MSLLIDIEGIDGSGKGTQARALCRRLEAAGVSHRLISFPRYEATLFGKAVGEYLDGRFGTLEQVHPFLVSLLFAGDRLESKAYLLGALRECRVVVLDRYIPSNVAHQASKRDGAERDELVRRIAHIEFGIFDLPHPDLLLLLDLPVPVARQMVARKAARNYTDKSLDLQEADAQYLERVRALYLEIAGKDPRWRIIPCCAGNEVRSIDEIGEEIWKIVEPRIASSSSSL